MTSSIPVAGEPPWPRVDVQGELERADREWLHTNGAGAYAMSTVALMHTRRYHGLLVAALDPPLERTVVLSHAETTVGVGRKQFRLSTHQFPGVAPTPGYRLLSHFSQDPIPRWEYRLGKSTLERTLSLARGRNALVFAYTWKSRSEAKLSLRPLMPLRPLDRLAREHGAMVQRAVLRPGAVEIQPVPSLPPIVFGHNGMFIGSPDWWRRFEYTEDRDRGEDCLEDMWTPGTFELPLLPNRTTYLITAVGALPELSPRDLVVEAMESILAQDPGPSHNRSTRMLSIAAEQFCVDSCPRPAMVAGYPLYDVRTRDLLLSLRGVYLCRGRVEQAKRALTTVCRAQRSGLLPERLAERRERGDKPSPEATLWLFEAAKQLLVETGNDDPFVHRVLFPALRRAFVSIRGGRRKGAAMSRDGLVVLTPEGPATWMDAVLDEQPVTPRHGAAVELQALWASGCAMLAELAADLGDDSTVRAARDARKRVQAAFTSRFWCKETSYAYDCISGDPGEWLDARIRPNAVMALALCPELFEHWQADQIISRARNDLLTAYGLRTLAPSDSSYHPNFAGSQRDRESAAHQGVAWTYLLGFFARAALALDPDDFELREDLRLRIENAVAAGPVLGQVFQLSDGDEPYRPRACPAQAWSVAELLRTMITELGL